jgi:hypothetical protein
LPRLKSLKVQPGHSINASGWDQISSLSQLESLWIPNSSAESAQANEDAHKAAAAALGRLKQLRQLNVENANLPPLPPMPNLEYAVLDTLKSLEQNLKNLAEFSPNLQEISLRPYDGFQLTTGMRDALRRMPSLRTIWIQTGQEPESKVLTPQIAILRASLPGVSVRRGEYSRFRSIGLFVFAVTMFWPGLIVTVHRTMMQSMPLAAYMPRYERPHVFWPLTAAAILVVVFLIVSYFFDIAWYAALAIGLSGVFFSSPPAYDWHPRMKQIVEWVSAILLIGVFLILFSLKTAPLFAEEFLEGELPLLAFSMICVGAILLPFKVFGATKQYRLWAQLETLIIPGLAQGMEQYGKAVPRSGKSRNPVVWLQDGLRSRRLQRSRTQSFTTKLMAATTSATGRFLLFLFIATALLLLHGFVLAINHAHSMPVLTIALLQGSLASLLITAVSWVGRRSSLALDLLRPVSRSKFWNSVRLAILMEMLPIMLITVASVFVLSWFESKSQSTPWLVLIPVVLICAIGFLAVLHAMIVWACITPRLWLALTVSLVGLMLIAGSAVATVPLIMNDGDGPPIAVCLSVFVMLSGAVAQYAISRSLPNRELGMISR